MRAIFKNSFLILLFLVPIFAGAQTGNIDIKGNIGDQNTGSGIGGVTVSIYRDGSLIESVTTSSNGKYKLKKTPVGGLFTVKFTKPGYVSKYAELDTRGIAPEDARDLPLEVNCDIFEEVPGVDFSVLDSKPVAKAKYNKDIDNMEWDMSYIEKTKKEVEKIITKAEEVKAATDKKFNDAVAAANTAMSKSDYKTAVTKYEEALAIKKDPEIEKKKNEAIEKEKLAAANAEVDKKYNDEMAEAKKLFDAKDYQGAKGKYQAASLTKPTETAPKDKIKEIDLLIAKQLEEETKYNKHLADGEKAMLSENYDEAIKQFSAAGIIRPNEQQPKDELKKAQDAKAKKEKDDLANKKKKEDFDKLVLEGDKNATAKSYADAITNYDKALALIDDAAVKAKRDKAQKDKDAADEIAKQDEIKKAEEKKRREEFDKIMAKGGEEMTATEYDKAIASFESALVIIPKEATAEAKLKEAKTKKAEKDAADKLALDNKAKKDKFDELVAKGDAEAGKNEYDKAIATYTEALLIFKDDAPTKAKLASAQQKKTDYLKNKADFDKFVSDGDIAVKTSKYDDAIAKYEAALKLFDDAAVQTKLDKAKSDKENADQTAMAEKKKRDEFDKIMAKGGEEMTAAEYDKAIASFESALIIIPKEATAEAKLKEAKAKKAEKDLNDQKAKDLAAKKAEFDKLVAQGDGEMSAETYDKAIASYTAALVLFKDDADAKAKLEDAKKKKAAADLLAKDNEAKQKELDAKFKKHYNDGVTFSTNSDFDKAISEFEAALLIKPDDKDAKDALATAKQRQKEYQDIKDQAYRDRIAVADKLFGEGNYTEAKAQYERASKQKPEETHPKNQIVECEKKIKEKEAADLAGAERRKNYEAYKTKGDEDFKASKWENAIANYEKALTYLDENYPKDQIDLARKNIENAMNTVNAEKKKREDFNALLLKGDGEVKLETFDDAIKSFEAALLIYPKEATAEAKLADAKKKKSEKELADQKNKDQAAKKAEFDRLVVQGDGEMVAATYDKAIASYTAALVIFKDDADVKDKLLEAQKKKAAADLIAKDNLTKQKELDAKFKKHYNDGVTYSTNTDFEHAIAEFEAALLIKPEDKDAKEALETAKIRLKEYKDIKDQAYRDRIAVADKLFGEKNYVEAKAQYERASKQKPEETHPKDRIKECDKFLADGEEMKKLRQQFDATMALGETELKNKNYDKAISFFEAAKIILPDEKTPDIRIAEANRLRDKEKNDSEMIGKRKEFDRLMNTGQEFMNNGEFDPAIEKFEAALLVIPNEPNAISALELAKTRKAQAAEEIEREKKRILEFADREFNASNWKDAKKYYEKYLKMVKSDAYAESQIEKCKKNMQVSTVNNVSTGNYDALIKEANKLLKEKEYLDAKSKYQEALTVYSTMEYPKKKIKEIDDILAEMTRKQQEAQRERDLAEAKKQKKDLNYGEKTMMSADDALALLLKAKLDDERNKYDEIQRKKDMLSSDNQNAEKTSETSREENYVDISNQKDLQIDFSTNTDIRDNNSDLYKLKKEQLEHDSRNWNTENRIDEANKQAINAIYDTRDLNQYEDRIRIINSENINADKDELANINKQIDQQASSIRNENGKDLVEKKDMLNDKYSQNGAMLIAENSNNIKDDFETLNNFNKKQNATANTIRENNSEQLKTEQDEFAAQNKFNQDKLMKENSDAVKNEFLNQHNSNQYIYSKAEVKRNENSVELNKQKDMLADQTKNVSDRLLEENAEALKTEFDDLNKRNQEMNNNAAITRDNNGVELKAKQDLLSNTQKTTEIRLLEENASQVKAEYDAMNARNMEQNAKAADIRNENGAELVAKKDLLANTTNSTENRLLVENGDEVKTEYETLNDLNAKLDAGAATTRNDNGKQLTEQKDNIKTITETGARSQADKIRELKERQEAMVAEQKKNEAEAEKKRWETGDKIHEQKDNALVYEKGEEGFKSQWTVDFPQGVTETVFTKKDPDGNINEVTIQRVVVKGDYGNEYRKVVSKTGTYYFKNNRNVTNLVWDMETGE